MKALFAGVAALLLLAAPMEKTWAQATPPDELGPSLRIREVLLVPPASGETYRLGERLLVTVTFNDFVAATGTPSIGLTIGSRTRQAPLVRNLWQASSFLNFRTRPDREYTFNEQRTYLVFTYIVEATDLDSDGISIAANALTLNGGTITSYSDATIAAALEHPAVTADTARKVDGRADYVQIRSPRNNPEQSGRYSRDPAWSPDGLKVTFALGDSGPDKLYIANTDGSIPVQLMPSSSVFNSVEAHAWSPDGTKIAVISNFGFNRGIWVMDADAGNPVLLNRGSTFTSLAWSPDGTQIAFTDSPLAHEEHHGIYVMNADGSSPRLVKAGYGHRPA